MRIAVLVLLAATHFGIGCDCGGGAGQYRPTVTIDAPAEGAFVNIANAVAVTLSGTCSDVGEPIILSGAADSTVTCIDKSWSATVDLTSLPDGVVMFAVNHSAASGGIAETATRALVKDTVAPTVTIDTPAAGTVVTPANDTSVTLGGTCSENGLPVTLSTGATAVCTALRWSVVVDVSASANGTITFTAQHVDAAGNAAITAMASFTKAATGPTVTIEAPALNSWVNAAAVSAFTVSGTCSENGQPVDISGSAVATTTCTASAWTVTLDVTAAPEGMLTVRANHSDGAGNLAQQVTRHFLKDSLTPTLASLSISNVDPSPTTTFTLTYGALSSPFDEFCLLENNTNAAACTWTTGTALPPAFIVMASAGPKAITVFLRDLAGNTSSITSSNSVSLDMSAPLISLTDPLGGQQILAGAQQAITWVSPSTDVSPMPVTLSFSVNGGTSWTPLAGTFAKSGTTQWTTPIVDSSQGRVRATIIDLAGNSATADSTSNFVIDSTPPVFTASSMSINGGTTTVTNNFVTVNFQVTDAAAPVSGYCLKRGPIAVPTPTDACWVTVPATPSLTRSVNFRLGFLPGPYTVYAWARNSVGLVTSLGTSGAGTRGTDSVDVTYAPVAPPTLTGVTASSSDSSVNLNVPTATPVFIKWTASSALGLAALPVSIFYTTDDTNYVQITAGVNNNQGAGCTVTSGQGCFVWAAGLPTSGYFRVRVGVTDANGRRSFQSSEPLNVGSTLKILAGATDPGTNGSAEAAVFVSAKPTSSYSDPASLIVSTAGVAYFIDGVRGLLKVDPVDGVQRLLFRKTGVLAVDGSENTLTVQGTGTVRDPSALAFDEQGRVLVFDYNRIRRYDPATGNLTLLIGGGSLTTSPVAATSLQIVSVTPTNDTIPLMFATADGSVYFQSGNYSTYVGNGYGLRKYDPVSGQVTAITFSGMGDGQSATQDIGACEGVTLGAAWNPQTSAITRYVLGIRHSAAMCPSVGANTFTYTVIDPASLMPVAPHPLNFNYTAKMTVGADGTLYQVQRVVPLIQRFDVPTQSWVSIAGTGNAGLCADGTAALSCDMDPTAVYGDANGQVYFLERGRIRAIDQGVIRTWLGASWSFGDGAPATSARIGGVFDVKLWKNGSTDTVVFTDNREFRIREFPIGGNIATVAGNGGNGLASLVLPAATQPISYANQGGIQPAYIQVDPTAGTIYSSAQSNNYISKIDRTTGLWSYLVGGGATLYSSNMANGRAGAQIDLGGYAADMLGFDGTRLMVHKYRYLTNNAYDSFLKYYTVTTGTQSALAGITGIAATVFGADGAMATASPVPYSYDDWASATLDTYLTSRWVFAAPADTTNLRTLTGGVMGTLATLPADARGAFAYRHDATHNLVYYCSATTGVINRYDVGTQTNAALPWPIAKMKCAGISIVFSASRNSLIFGFDQDGLGGIAEYFNP